MNKTTKEQHTKEYWNEQLKATLWLILIAFIIVVVAFLINSKDILEVLSRKGLI